MENKFIFSEDNISNAVTAWENEALREKYQDDLCELFKRAISNNNKFSPDSIVNMAMQHAINLYFYPTSDSYCKYGQYLTIVDVPAEEKMRMQSNDVRNQNYSDSINLVALPENSAENVDVAVNIKDIYEIESM